MQVEHYAAADVTLAQSIVRLLDRLKGNGEDDELHSLLTRGVQHFGNKGEINGDCARWMHRQLEQYASDPLNSVRSRIRARLLQQRLYAYLPDALMEQETSAPIQSATTIPAAAPAPGRNGNGHFPNEVRAVPKGPVASAPIEIARREPKPAAPPPQKKPMPPPWVDQREVLVQRLVETSERLRTVQAENDKLREDVAQMEVKVRRRKTPKAVARSAAKSVRKPTPMPKRESFLRQLEIEIDRVRRHGAPLALALVDINDLEDVDRDRGREGVNAVLRCYISEIFGNFRSYDVVGRYHEDEFAVFFPNTIKEGALRALEKAQKRAAETHLAFEGQSFPLPGFTSSLTNYVVGEDIDVLLARAVDGLIAARGQEEENIIVT